MCSLRHLAREGGVKGLRPGPRCHTTAGGGWNASQRRDAWPGTASAGAAVHAASVREPAAPQVPSAAATGLRLFPRYEATGSHAESTTSRASTPITSSSQGIPCPQNQTGFPWDGMSKKNALIHASSSARAQVKKALPLCCPGWKLHPPKRAWYQHMVARVWAARRPPIARYLVPVTERPHLLRCFSTRDRYRAIRGGPGVKRSAILPHWLQPHRPTLRVVFF